MQEMPSVAADLSSLDREALTALVIDGLPLHWASTGEAWKGREVTRLAQRVMHCPCGNPKVLAIGLCSTCYTLKRQDEEYFGGLREAVLERDGYRCRVCDASGRDKRSIIVHHRVPGKSVMNLMLSLCPGCHAKIHRTKAVLSVMPALLLELWREQHPKGHEQVQLDFTSKKPVAKLVPLFENQKEPSR